MRGTEGRPSSKGDRQAVAHASVGQAQRRAVNFRFDSDRRKQTRDRCARPHHIAQANAAILAGREVAGSSARDVVARDSDPAHPMVEPLERRMFQLRQPLWNDAAQPGQRSRQSAAQPHVQAVDQEVPTAEMSRVANEFVDRQTDGRVIRRDDSTRTRSDDDVDRDCRARRARARRPRGLRPAGRRRSARGRSGSAGHRRATGARPRQGHRDW